MRSKNLWSVLLRFVFLSALALSSVAQRATAASMNAALNCNPDVCPSSGTCPGGLFCDPDTLSCEACDDNFPDLMCPCDGYACVDHRCTPVPEETGPECGS